VGPSRVTDYLLSSEQLQNLILDDPRVPDKALDLRRLYDPNIPDPIFRNTFLISPRCTSKLKSQN
jgi:hypothetical protein